MGIQPAACRFNAGGDLGNHIGMQASEGPVYLKISVVSRRLKPAEGICADQAAKPRPVAAAGGTVARLVDDQPGKPASLVEHVSQMDQHLLIGKPTAP